MHRFEGKPLVQEFIPNTMLGIEYLWGGKVQLETSEVKAIRKPGQTRRDRGAGRPAFRLRRGDRRSGGRQWQRVRYTMKDQKLSRGLV